MVPKALDEGPKHVALLELCPLNLTLLWKLNLHYQDSNDKYIYYSTIASFYHIWSRERAKYETVIHCSVLV